MGLRVCDLPSIRWQKVRVFELKSLADLKRRKRINLRDTYEPATIARRIGVLSRDLKSLGISHESINIRQLGRALDAGVVAPNLNLRTGETKDPDLLLRVIVGRLGREDETLDFNFTLSLTKLTDEKIKIALTSKYLRGIKDLPSYADILSTAARLCHPENPAGQKQFILSVLKNNFRNRLESDASTAGELTVMLARIIYPNDLPALVIMIGNAAQVIYNKCGHEEVGKFLGSAARSLYPEDLPAQRRVILNTIPNFKSLNDEVLAIGLLDGLALTDPPERDDFIAAFIKRCFPPAPFSRPKAKFILRLASYLYPDNDKDRDQFIVRIVVKLYPNDSDIPKWKRLLYAIVIDRGEHYPSSSSYRQGLLDDLLIQCSFILHPK
jgi:hypothetical protein